MPHAHVKHPLLFKTLKEFYISDFETQRGRRETVIDIFVGEKIIIFLRTSVKFFISAELIVTTLLRLRIIK